MATTEADLQATVRTILQSAWAERDGTVIPVDTSLTLGKNDGIKLDATVLYADLADSTKLVDARSDHYAAEVYKSFLHCAAKVINNEGGTITAYDGDRVMAVYLGDSKNTAAVRTALKINYAVKKIINPALKLQYPTNHKDIEHVVGIDSSELFVARTGVRGANDLVWVGRAANYAAKLSALPSHYPAYITREVFDSIADVAKFTRGESMWEPVKWDSFDNRIIYRSSWTWKID